VISRHSCGSWLACDGGWADDLSVEAVLGQNGFQQGIKKAATQQEAAFVLPPVQLNPAV
jgi:hypothetical protein